MATDPFDGISPPNKDGSNEIGQPTFVELIWAKECEVSPAIGKNIPDVGLSLNRVAFGKDCVNSLEENITEAPVLGAAQNEAENIQYQIERQSHSYRLDADKIREQKINNVIRNNITNDYMASRNDLLNQGIQLYAVGLDNNSANYNQGAKWDPQGGTLISNPTTVGSNGGPSAYGTYDQSGNVQEWCDGHYQNQNGSYNIPLLRGGDYASSLAGISSIGRAGVPSTSGGSSIGFRIASRSWPGVTPSVPNPFNLPYFVSVGDLGNNGDNNLGEINSEGYGKVDYSYAIGQYTVTTQEYTRFLNAIASTDTYGLYKALVAPDQNPNTHTHGILRSNSESGYYYTVVDKMADKPINFLTWWDCARYCNWLHNGQPNGPQNASTTEDGAYALNGKVAPSSQFDIPVVKTGAKYHIPTEDEWYKAAYYKRSINVVNNKSLNENTFQPTAILISQSEIIEPPPGATLAKIWAVGAGSISVWKGYGGGPGGGLASSSWPLLPPTDAGAYKLQVSISDNTQVKYLSPEIGEPVKYYINATGAGYVPGDSDPNLNGGPTVTVKSGGMGSGTGGFWGGAAGTTTPTEVVRDSISCGRRKAELPEELQYALYLAGVSTSEECYDVATFGSGAGMNKYGAVFSAGYGGGGISGRGGITAQAGGGAVVILFTTEQTAAQPIAIPAPEGDKFEIAQIITETNFPYSEIPIPEGCTTIKAWAVGGGQDVWDLPFQISEGGGQAGQVVVKSWKKGAANTISVQIIKKRTDYITNGNAVVTYNDSSINASSPTGGIGSNGDVDDLVAGRPGDVRGTNGLIRGGAIGGGGQDTSGNCPRRQGGDFSGLMKAVALAGGKTMEDCGDTPAFGSSGGVEYGPLHGNTFKYYNAGYGGGGAKAAGSTPGINNVAKAGEPAVVLLFTGYTQLVKSALRSESYLVTENTILNIPTGCVGYKIWLVGPGESVYHLSTGMQVGAGGRGGCTVTWTRTSGLPILAGERLNITIGRPVDQLTPLRSTTQVDVVNGQTVYASLIAGLYGGENLIAAIDRSIDTAAVGAASYEGEVGDNLPDNGRVRGGSIFLRSRSNDECARRNAFDSTFNYSPVAEEMRQALLISKPLPSSSPLVKTIEDCGLIPAFGSGGGVTFGPAYGGVYTAYDAGYGGGGAITTATGTPESNTIAKAGSGAVLIKLEFDERTPPPKEYWLYATQSDSTPLSVSTDSVGNGPLTTSYSIGNSSSANFNSGANWNGSFIGNITTVGGNGGPSAYGTYDQDGNVFEWTDYNTLEGSVRPEPTTRALQRPARGGGLDTPLLLLQRAYRQVDVPNIEFNLGFRVASRFENPNPNDLPNWATIGDINNTKDSNGYGLVAYPYAIAKYAVTNCEYAEFLNSVAKTDSVNLFNPNHVFVPEGGEGFAIYGGIKRNGSPGNWIYEIIDNMGNKPVVFVNWYQCARYCNWLHNGKPVGPQNASTTEDGAYTMQGMKPVESNANAKYHLPTEDEWYKAAYYRKGGANAGYWLYATQSDNIPTPATANAEGDGLLNGNPANVTLYACPQPTSSGTTTFNKLRIRASGNLFVPCTPDVIIEDVVDGRSVNEKQSIILPTATGGRWELSWRYDGQTQSVTIPYGATAAVVRNRFGSLSITGGRVNLNVDGTGTSADPYVIEFINDLGASNHRLVQVDASALIGSSDSYTTKIVDGSTNEQKTITNTNSSTRNFTVSFSGVTSANIAYNSSLNKITSIIEGMSNIGAGNVRVDGDITDRDAAYRGPYRITFIGDYANQNVSDMSVRPTPDYNIVTDWNGGASGGTNEKQLININSKGGTYKLILTSPGDTPVTSTTANINYNATAAQIKSAIDTATPWLLSQDFTVTQILRNEGEGRYRFVLEFTGQYAKQDMPLAQLDNQGLNGSAAIVTTLQIGTGIREQQRITVVRANSGIFTLSISFQGRTYVTEAIQFNESADSVRDIITALSPFDEGDVTVTDLPKTDPEQSIRCLIVFKRRFGNLPTIVATFTNTLSCNPNLFPRVPKPPYDYPLPDCNTQDQSFDYDDGPLLCHPGEGDPPIDVQPCCGPNFIPNSANVSNRLKIERDLFDPNLNYTIKQLATAKGLSTAEYTPYIRKGTDIVETTYDTVALSKMSIILVHNQLNNTGAIGRIVQQVQSREILAKRFDWPDCGPAQYDKCWK